MASTDENTKPDGAAFDAHFESLGKQAEGLTISDANGEAEDSADEQKVVDEIESLCMNCHENVSAQSLHKPKSHSNGTNRELRDSSSLAYHSSAKLSSCPSTVRIATSRMPRFNPPAKSNKRDLAMSCVSRLQKTLPAR